MKQHHAALRFDASSSRAGFTVIEVVVAVTILMTALVVVAQVGFWCLSEQQRCRDRTLAAELAANALESARALPWDQLTAEWAAAQQLPEAYRQESWKLQVKVSQERSSPHVKRVTVTVQSPPQDHPLPPVELAGWFSARASTGGLASLGGSP